MKKSNLLWGFFFIAAAFVIVFSQLGYLGDITLLNLIILILVIPVIIKSLLNLTFPGIFFPLALLGIVFAKPLGIEDLTPWPILVVALFASIGFSLIFKKNKFCSLNSKGYKSSVDFVDDGQDDSEVNFAVSFGSGAKYINSEKLKQVNVNVSFGAVQVYFDNAALDPKGAELNLNVEFSGAELYIPKEWNVEINVDTMMGGIDEKNKRYNTAKGPTLVIKGRISLAGIEITYV